MECLVIDIFDISDMHAWRTTYSASNVIILKGDIIVEKKKRDIIIFSEILRFFL